ncbi:DHHW family protein [uncultured Allofournierella sp.]|uniref:DHHW family protein n=1 Tax=uncultured Allofournierella sp. TaxID=1940258 RepID=UPI003753E3D9
MKEKCKELLRYPLLVLFFLFLVGFMVLDGLWPKRSYSDLERRQLNQFPAFSLSQLIQNKWTADYDSYTKDQVVFRDTWMKLQSLSERLLFQKVEIGGAVIGKNDALFTKMFGLTNNEEKLLNKNTLLVQQFAENFPGKVTLMLAPSASLIYQEELPAGTPMLDENTALDTIFDAVGQDHVLDLRQPFEAAKADKLYYSTDHHWTTWGAYLAYRQFCSREGLDPLEVTQQDFTQVPDFYGTTYAKALYWKTQPDTLDYLELPNQLTVWNIDSQLNLTESFTAGLYDTEKFDTVDKYAAFLYGNNGYTTIQGNGEGSILVVKDSYANSFVPFLCANYERIGVIDPRGYKLSIQELAQQEGYDNILLLFNFQTFKSSNDLNGLAVR